MTGRIVLLVTSPRLPAGLMTAQAWDVVRTLPVLAGEENEQTEALRAAGVPVRVFESRADEVLAAADPDVVWFAGPTGDQSLARELGMRLAREPGLAELELMYGSWDPPGARVLDAVAVMDRLLSPGGRRPSRGGDGVLFGTEAGRGAARSAARLADPAQRQRLRRQRAGVRTEAQRVNLVGRTAGPAR